MFLFAIFKTMKTMNIVVPVEFDYEQNLQFLKRSPKEILHRVEEDGVVKLLQVNDELILFKVKSSSKGLTIEFLNSTPSAQVQEFVRNFVREWFDLETDL